MKLKKIVALIFIVSIWSCSDDDATTNDYGFIDQDVKGLIASDSWTYEYARALPQVEALESIYSIRLFIEENASACGVISSTEDYFHFKIPAEVGVYEVNENFYAYIVDTGGNSPGNSSRKGAIEIISISPTEVVGRLNVRVNDENYLNGNFTAGVCPQ